MEILEICCRHPDWRDVPLETYVEIENPPAKCEEEFYNIDDYNYEYEDSTCIKVKTCSLDFLKNISKLDLVQCGIFLLPIAWKTFIFQIFNIQPPRLLTNWKKNVFQIKHL